MDKYSFDVLLDNILHMVMNTIPEIIMTTNDICCSFNSDYLLISSLNIIPNYGGLIIIYAEILDGTVTNIEPSITY
jgi:hypothetical protein